MRRIQASQAPANGLATRAMFCLSEKSGSRIEVTAA
jgi:hypothetical protein